MKNRILIAVVAAAMAQVVFGATETLNGVRYTTRGNTEASCRVADAGDKSVVEVEVPEQVLIDGLPYSVTSVEGRGFKGAKHIKVFETAQFGEADRDECIRGVRGAGERCDSRPGEG